MVEIKEKSKTGQQSTREQPEKFILEVTDMKKYFPIKAGILQRTIGQVKAVDGFSLQIKPGETIGIVGESGCGKSTMGRTLIRLYEPTEGSIIFNGTNITDLPEKKLKKTLRKKMQMIFQDPYASLNPRKTLGDAILEPLNTHQLYHPKDRQKRVRELLEKVGLNNSFINRYPHELSGGQRQRIGIARALASEPELIIADEAVSALDVSIQAQIINLLQQLQKEFDLTYLFISHDLSVVRHISDRVGVMCLGKMVELATKDDLYDTPLHPYTQAMLSAVPVSRKNGAVKRERIILTGDLPSPANPPSGCVFHTRCPLAMDVCRQAAPEFKEVKKDQFVACHLY